MCDGAAPAFGMPRGPRHPVSPGAPTPYGGARKHQAVAHSEGRQCEVLEGDAYGVVLS